MVVEQNKNLARAGELSDAASAAMTCLARLADADRAAVLRAHGLALAPRLWRVQDGHVVPTLTGLVEDRDRERIYASQVWCDAYRPERSVVVYVLQSAGLAALSAALGGIGVSKIGTADAANVERRIRDLGISEYGAWMRTARSYEHSPGFAQFTPATGLQLAPQHPSSPVELGLFGFDVGLPGGLTSSRFEAELNARLLPLRLQSLADGAFGRRLHTRLGFDAAALRRYYQSGGRFKAATELTMVRPRADSAALAKIAADIVIDHVLGVLTRRSGR